jgi:carboxymethylenebutenolidase
LIPARVRLFFLAALMLAPAMSQGATAIEGQALRMSTNDQEVSLVRYAAPGTLKRPAVLLLHGFRCVADCARDFERYARAFAHAGMDAYVLHYYRADDYAALKEMRLDDAHYSERFKRWTRVVGSIVSQVATSPLSDERVALVGFSQGGRLAIASAANGARLGALVVLYARLPRTEELNEAIRQLPSTFILHGSADKMVPVADGNAIFLKAQQVGAQAEMIVFPGVGHGFDFSEDGKEAVIARHKVLDFVARQFNAGK